MTNLKSDKYRKSRGGYSRLLDLFCTKCGKYLFSYQKDGPGILKRLYTDRIISKALPSGKNWYVASVRSYWEYILFIKRRSVHLLGYLSDLSVSKL